jgi:AraC family transcriptional regulator of adaptative response/methylated-DNA-[protein]-cysteine methyltransferase
MSRNAASSNESVTRDPRWAAVVARDAAADGRFFYAVRTTGIYCRPGCASRTPRPGNIEFFRTSAAAERAGFRPCKRCRPDQPVLAIRQAAQITELCRLIESSERTPTLEQLARHAGWSPWHLHRVFKAIAGVTPKSYADACRARRIRRGLSRGERVTETIYGAGFGSSSRFYEKADGVLGMTPTRYKSGGAGTQIRFAIGRCSLGEILVAASTRGICAIALGDDADLLLRDLQDRFPRAALIGGNAKFERMVAQVIAFVESPKARCDLPLDVRGTAFQQKVWQALRRIPPGKTMTYSEIACRIGAPTAVRAVAGACAANAVAVVIPCHRVVRSDGTLSGYRWGVARKRALLAREAAD